MDGRIYHPSRRVWGDHGNLIWDEVAFFESRGWQPMRYQRAFLEARQPIVTLFAGVGSGKSLVANIRTVTQALMNPGGISIVGLPSNVTIDINVIPDLEAIVPIDQVVPPRKSEHGSKVFRHDKLGGFYEIRWKNGHRTIFRTMSSAHLAFKRSQGPTCCFLRLDEIAQMDRGAFTTLIERLRDQEGAWLQYLITGSLDEPGWIEDFFDEGKVDDSMVCIIRASTRDATFRSGEYVKLLSTVLTDTEARRKLDAEVVYLEGLVYGGFLSTDRDHPTWMEVPESRHPITIGMDLGFRRTAWVALQEHLVHGELVDVIVDQGIYPETLPHEVGMALLKRFDGYIIDAIYTDYSTESEPDRKVLQRVMSPVPVRPAVMKQQKPFYRIGPGVNLVRSRCQGQDGIRRLYISPKLHPQKGQGTDMHLLVDALSKYIEPPHRRRYHILDALRYAVMGKHNKPMVEIGGYYG
jgi:hypothetical protein